ncbi:hypothetical protein [Halomontanus rarus]|uniref:hypothetical protein n=1 Tax=Halomontanus rarus TaxID=3034020 RepID=UPI00293BC185|nr:hypothetical protein [Halovivax sp. KZCA124]
MERRKFLIGGVGALATAISGCLGSNSTPSTNNSDDDNDDSSQGNPDTDVTDTPTDEGPNDSIGNYDPKAVTKTYYTALNKGNASKLNALSHPSGVAVNNIEDWEKQYGDEYKLSVNRTEVIAEDLVYFSQPYAVVEVGIEQKRDGNSYLTRHQSVLVVEEGELLVFDIRGEENEILTGESTDSCQIDTDSDVLELLPYTTASFYQVSRDESFGNGEAYYRGPDGNRFKVIFGVHDSEEEAQEVELGLDRTHSYSDGEWTSGAALLARKGTMTCDVRVETADATDQVEALYQQTGCFTDDHVVERSW